MGLPIIDASSDPLPWRRWLWGAAVCVVCGGMPTVLLEFPPAALALLPSLQPNRDTRNAPAGYWRVPTCETHSRWAIWPIRVQLALMDEAAFAAAGASAGIQRPIWPELAEPEPPRLPAAARAGQRAETAIQQRSPALRAHPGAAALADVSPSSFGREIVPEGRDAPVQGLNLTR